MKKIMFTAIILLLSTISFAETFVSVNSQNHVYVASSSQAFDLTFSGVDLGSTYTYDYTVLDYEGDTVASDTAQTTSLSGSTFIDTLNLSVSQIGWFRVNLTLYDDGVPVTLTNTYITDVGGDDSYFTFANIRTAPTQDATSPFGIAENIADATRSDLIIKAGIKYQRLDTRTRIMYPSADTYDWTLSDSYESEMQSNGIIWLPLIAYGLQNSLSTDSGCGNSGARCLPVIDPHWNNIINAMVARYSEYEYWEVWNEADITTFWDDTDANFWTLLTTTYDLIKAINSTYKVLHGGVAGKTNSTWLSDLNASGASGDFDIYNAHPYSHPNTPESTASFMNMQHNNVSGKDLWITEIGWPSYTWSNTLTEQAQNTVRAIALAFGFQVKKIFIYELANNDTTDSATEDATTREDNFGLTFEDFEPKPSYAAYANLIYRLTGKTNKRIYVRDGTKYLVYMTTNNRDWVVAAWTTDSSATASISIGNNNSVTVSDIMGVESSSSPSNNRLSLAVSRDIKFVEFTGEPFQTAVSGSNLSGESL